MDLLEISYHRILVRHNFWENSRGYWTETRKERMEKGNETIFSYVDKYAYPLNILEKPKITNELLTWCETKNVYGVGRWGTSALQFGYSCKKALDMVDRLEKKY